MYQWKAAQFHSFHLHAQDQWRRKYTFILQDMHLQWMLGMSLSPLQQYLVEW